ncbi:MAG: sulfatase-like hydrolase/transferase [Burkholderiales bacterium]
MQPNLIVILVDDLRFDEFGAGGHPYMRTPHIDRIANEGVHCINAFHTTPLCSPNRASILTGQYASRHGIIDNVARDAASHRLPNYHIELQKLGYETAHIGKWHMGNSADPRPGYDTWISFPGHGSLEDPEFNENGNVARHRGYITDLLNERAVRFIEQPHAKPFAFFLAHKAVHPDAFQAPDGTLDLTREGGGYKLPARHRDLYRDAFFPPRPNVQTLEAAAKQKPVWTEAVTLRKSTQAQAALNALHAGTQEEIRLRAAMMASVDEGVGAMFDALTRKGMLDETCILFLGDNGYFFGEHGLGPERRFAYEEGIRCPFIMRYPRKVKAGMRIEELVLALDIAPTMIALAGGRPGPWIQGHSLAPLFAGRRADWRKSFMAEYFSENAMSWLIGMTYKAVRTKRYKYIHWVNKNGANLDELYDLETDPYEMKNLFASRAFADVRVRMQRELRNLVAESIGL